jgi:hypothetical protein
MGPRGVAVGGRIGFPGAMLSHCCAIEPLLRH